MSRPDPPSPARWREVQRLFDVALEQPSGARAAWLASSGADAALQDEVAALLAADAAPVTLLDHPPGPSLVAPVAPVAPTPPADPLAAGGVVGPYRLLRTLGRGGMGVVHLARDTRTGDDVALKVLRPVVADALATVDARRRFLREIRLGEQVAHPALVPVLDAGEADGRLWFAMPYVPGETLGDRLRRAPRQPPGAVASVGAQVARALAWLAARGIVHRDVKPDNILLSIEAGGAVRARLADFGVARALDLADVDGRLTATGVLLGTVRYMSPEQVRGAPVGGAADVFALGAVLYEALAGEPALRGAAQRALLGHGPVAHPAPPDVRRLRDDVPELLADALRRALAPDPRDRPTADALAATLDAAAPGA